MKFEELVGSSYEAAYLKERGFDCKLIPRSNNLDVDYSFHRSKRLEEARQQFRSDIDLEGFIKSHREIKWIGRDFLKNKRGLQP